MNERKMFNNLMLDIVIVIIVINIVSNKVKGVVVLIRVGSLRFAKLYTCA